MKIIISVLSLALLFGCWKEMPKPYDNSNRSVKIQRNFSLMKFEEFDSRPETATIFFMPTKEQLAGKNYQAEIKQRYATIIEYSDLFDQHYLAMSEERPRLAQLMQDFECGFWDRDFPEDRKDHSEECLQLFDRDYELTDRDSYLLGVLENQVNLEDVTNWYKPTTSETKINLAEISKNLKSDLVFTDLIEEDEYREDEGDIRQVKFYQLPEDKMVKMLEFTLYEKDQNGEYTGIRWEFKLEVSSFDKYLRLKGDVTKKRGSEEIQFGSAKFDFPPKSSEDDWEDDDDWDEEDDDWEEEW